LPINILIFEISDGIWPSVSGVIDVGSLLNEHDSAGVMDGHDAGWVIDTARWDLDLNWVDGGWRGVEWRDGSVGSDGHGPLEPSGELSEAIFEPEGVHEEHCLLDIGTVISTNDLVSLGVETTLSQLLDHWIVDLIRKSILDILSSIIIIIDWATPPLGFGVTTREDGVGVDFGENLNVVDGLTGGVRSKKTSFVLKINGNIWLLVHIIPVKEVNILEQSWTTFRKVTS